MMHVTPEQAVKAAATVANCCSIPTREDSWNEPPWYSEPLNFTRMRPVADSGGAWVSYSYLPMFPDYVAMIRHWIMTSQTDPSTTDLRWRILYRGRLLSPVEFDISNSIDMNLQRNETHPWPGRYRDVFIRVKAGDNLEFQVANNTGATQLMVLSVAGWYYPDTRNRGETSAQEGITDVG